MPPRPDTCQRSAYLTADAMTVYCVHPRRNCFRLRLPTPLDILERNSLLQEICINVMRILLPLLTACLFLVSCGENKAPSPTGKPVVFVPVPPYAGLVERIAGDKVEVVSLVGENGDPHTFSPTPKTVAALASARIYFTADLPFEEQLLKKLAEANTDLRIVSLVDGLDRRAFAAGEHDHHDHGEDDHDHDHDHDHSDEEIDPHVWLAPALLIEQINILENSLASLLDTPEEKDVLAENSLALIFEVTALDKELATALSPLRGRKFYVYHGAFGYFAESYGLEQKTIELSGRSPEPKQLVDLVNTAKTEGVKVIFVQPQFDTSSAENLAEAIGGSVVAIDPLARDVISNLKDIAEKLNDDPTGISQ